MPRAEANKVFSASPQRDIATGKINYVDCFSYAFFDIITVCYSA
jgi:hypothetical protein